MDGLPVEFCQTMWHLIRFDFLEMVSEVYQNEILSNSQRKGMIRLILRKLMEPILRTTDLSHC